MLSRNAIFTIHAKGSIYNPLKKLVGTTGFEPATTCPPDKYATKLRYAPIIDGGLVRFTSLRC